MPHEQVGGAEMKRLHRLETRMVNSFEFIANVIYYYFECHYKWSVSIELAHSTLNRRAR